MSDKQTDLLQQAKKHERYICFTKNKTLADENGRIVSRKSGVSSLGVSTTAKKERE